MRAQGADRRRNAERAPRAQQEPAPSEPALTLQSSIGNEAVARLVAQRRAHAAEADRQDDARTQHQLLAEAMTGPSRALPDALRGEAESFYRNDLSATRLHDDLTAQRATAALGAEAMTVGTHVFFGPGTIGRKEIVGHELGHVDKNLRGHRETGTTNGAGVAVTDPGQQSERTATADGAAFAAGARTAPSVAQRASTGQHPGADLAVQRAPGTRKRAAEQSDMSRIVEEIEHPTGGGESYQGGGTSKRIPKDDKEAACWEWAIRAAIDTNQTDGLDRGQFWAFLTGFSEAEDVRNLDQLAPEVRGQLDALRKDLTSAGLASGMNSIDRGADNATILPLMQRAVEIFVSGHGFRIQRQDPAAWVMCQYRMTGNAGVPEHWWIELPTPRGERVLTQTVPGMDHVEVGGTNLRWHTEGSAPGRQSNSEEYQLVEVPVAALKDRHTEILKRLLDKRAKRA